MAKSNFSISGFSYKYFGWTGKALSRIFYSNRRFSLDQTLQNAGLRIYPEAYFSIIGFFFILALVVTIIVVALTGIVFFVVIPPLVILLGYVIPKIAAHDRASKLDLEVPFAGTYVSVMGTGGLSPYVSLRRLKDCSLLPNISKAVKDIEVDVQVRGLDPVTAMEKSAEHLPSKDYKDLMLGYASTLRTGGDVIHYLLVRTETMFRDLATKVKAFGERAATLMESYIAISILTTLSLTILFMTSIAFQGMFASGFNISTFFLYSYILIPAVSFMFVYLADSQQISEPINEWGPYKIFFVSLPFMIFMMLTMFVPFLVPEFSPPFVKPFKGLITLFTVAVGLEPGYEAAVGLGLSLLIGTLPATLAHSYYTSRGKGIEHDVTNFMRDITEARKTGASPEKCLENLAGRNYGKFTKQLATTSRQIRWGLSFKVIYETVRQKVKSWLALINIYLLVDAIEVGGGTPETLDTLTRFSEMLSSLDKEKKAMLRPLLIMPYIGAGVLLFTTIIFLGFMRFVLASVGQYGMSFPQFVTWLLPPILLQAYLTGLVCGKISSGTLSSGFKHAMILVAAAIILMIFSGYFSLPFQTSGLR